MASAILCCSFVLLLYLQGNNAQQGLPNNQNVGVNNAIGFQQQALQRTNTPNNMNQTPNGGLNMNLPQQSNFPQQGNLQQPSGNFQPSLSFQANLQPQGGSGSLGNIQFTKQGSAQLPPGLVISPSKPQSCPTQTNNGCRQNAQTNQQQNNMGLTSNVSPSQTQNAHYSSNSLAELAALKGYPSLSSLFASQNNIAEAQQNQQMSNFNQNQLTDVQKQFLVRALQSQSSGQNQPGVNYAQTQFRGSGADTCPIITIPASPVSSQQSQGIVTQVASQPPFITVQAQPFTNYQQNQQPQQLVEEPSMLNLILSELQGSDPQYNMYPPYPVQKRESKSNMKSLIPLIINLLKEKSSCGCQNCGCPNNGAGSKNVPDPTIFSGYSGLMNYGQGTVETTKASNVEEAKSKSNKKEKKNVKKKVVTVDSAEGSEENDSEDMDYSEED